MLNKYCDEQNMDFANKVVVFALLFHGKRIAKCFNCDFENDLCDWKQDAFDDFNWTRHTGGTPSGNTGPVSDHTTGSGYYIYIETSYPRLIGDTARLISPSVEPGSYCLIFWYSMYGQNIRKLNVYMKAHSGKETILFTKQEDTKSAEWKRAVLGLNSVAEYKVIFEGITGEAKADIAVDDIYLTKGTCSIDCDFDSDICNWVQSNGDNFDWEKWKGSQQAVHSLPLSDHTSGGGSFIYIDTSYPRIVDDRAKLISLEQESGIYCLTFWYTMYGDDVNRLTVSQMEEGNVSYIITDINKAGDLGWTKANFSFQSFTKFQIVLEGVCGNGTDGDIAVDDISMNKGFCPTESPFIPSGQTSKPYPLLSTSETQKAIETVQTTSSLNTLYSTVQNTEVRSSKRKSTVPATSTRNMVTTKTSLQQEDTSPGYSATSSTETSRTYLSTKLTNTVTEISSTPTPQTNTVSAYYFSDVVETNHTTTEFTQSVSLQLDGIPSSQATVRNQNKFSGITDKGTLTITTEQSTEMDHGVLTKIYITFTSVTVILLLATTTLIFFVCRLRCNKITNKDTKCEAVQTSEDTFEVVLHDTSIESTFTDVGTNCHTNKLRSLQDQYSEVSLDNVYIKDANKDQSSLLTEDNLDKVNIYNHIVEHGNLPIETSYSRWPDLQVSKVSSNPHETERNTLIAKSEETDTADASRRPEGDHSVGTELVTMPELEKGLNSTYDHITAGGKPHRKKPDAYSHLAKFKRTEQNRKFTYGYASVFKKRKTEDVKLELSEGRGDICPQFQLKENKFDYVQDTDETCSERPDDLQQQGRVEYVCWDIESNNESDCSECNGELKQDYFILEKIDCYDSQL